MVSLDAKISLEPIMAILTIFEHFLPTNFNKYGPDN